MADGPRGPHRFLWWAPVAGAMLALFAAVAAWQTAPADAALVRDDAALMTAAQRDALAAHHRRLLEQHDIDYRVVTVSRLADIDRSAVELFRELGRESSSEGGRGLLLLIDAGTDQVRLEVGYPLEATFPDAFVSYVERQQMVPFFRRGRVADGIVATTELIVSRAQDGVDPGLGVEPGRASSGGAGATVTAHLGDGPDGSAAGPRSRVQPGATPRATLDAYLEAMASHDDDPRLPIYTAATRDMLEGWLVTPAQMDNVVRMQRRCTPDATVVDPAQRHAVVRYAPSQRGCAPYFFQRRDRRWLLDLVTMQQVIRFDAANAWRFVPGARHPYGFAFADWRFDERGYPHRREDG